MFKYSTKGTCSSEICFEIENERVKNVRFTKGCPGNLQAISKLVEGMHIKDVTLRLRGIVCRNGTSCADQLATALEDAHKKQSLSGIPD